MAKDNRHGKANTQQESLSRRAKTGTRRKKKSGVPVGKIVLAVLGLVALIACIFFVRAVWNFIGSRLTGDSEEDVPPTPYEDSAVAYYAFGLMGEDEKADFEMLSLVCYDKDAKTVNVMQMPASTYLGDPERWTVSTIGSVWANPTPLDWCETCRKRVYADEIKDGHHDAKTADGAYCGAKITQKAGSAVNNLTEVFRHQYSIELDNFFLIPQEGFVKLVDWVNGVDVELGSAMTLDGIDYSAGVHTLNGQGALEYILDTGSSVSSEIDNLKTQRKVYAALFERLFACDRTYLDDEVLWPLMKGSTPIRTRRENYAADDITLMIDLVQDLATVPRENIKVYLMPGEAATASGEPCYSVHKKELAELLNAAFNPDGAPIEIEHLRMTELANTTADDMTAQTMRELLTAQSGLIEGEEE